MKLEERVLEKLSSFRGKWPILQSSLRKKERKEKVLPEISMEDLRNVRSIREKAIQELEENIERLKRVLEEKGAELYIARDGVEASKIVIKICKENNVKLIVKSKSLTTEEIELNKFLESEGIEVIETDLGERLIQLAGQKPSHILGPALHMTRYEIAEILSKYYGRKILPDPREIVLEVRREFREKYQRADMVITGANLIIAENGAIVLVTNEGNDRLSLAFAPIHVVIAGVEKIVPSTKDALRILKVLCRKATGQRLSSYVSFNVPSSLAYPKDGMKKIRKTIYILIDNGRMNARRDEDFRKALYCIRCASCLEVCPPYNMLGGHVFGYIYSGPMGIPWTMITHGLKNTEFAQLCNICGLCKEECPVDIDLPYLNILVKKMYGEAYGYPSINRKIKRYEKLIDLGSKLPSFSNTIMNQRLFKKLIEEYVGIDRRISLPRFSSKSLGEIFKEIGGGERGKIALFTDSMLYYFLPELALKAVDILSKLGFKIILPKQKSSGMPLIQNGFINEAREVALYNVSSLYKLVDRGYKVVTLEPTSYLCISRYYPKILQTRESIKVSENTYTFYSLLKTIGWSELENIVKKLDNMSLIYHKPCHTLMENGSIPVIDFIEKLNANVMFRNAGCCGLAGTWGMKKNGHGYDIGIEIGKWTLDMYEKLRGEMIVTECTACYIQFSNLSKHLPVKHVLELIQPL
ncbi:MAG: LUD domain-containing protein [Nitrososphaerota archaeon]